MEKVISLLQSCFDLDFEVQDKQSLIAELRNINPKSYPPEYICAVGSNLPALLRVYGVPSELLGSKVGDWLLKVRQADLKARIAKESEPLVESEFVKGVFHRKSKADSQYQIDVDGQIWIEASVGGDYESTSVVSESASTLRSAVRKAKRLILLAKRRCNAAREEYSDDEDDEFVTSFSPTAVTITHLGNVILVANVRRGSLCWDVNHQSLDDLTAKYSDMKHEREENTWADNYSSNRVLSLQMDVIHSAIKARKNKYWAHNVMQTMINQLRCA